MAVFLSAFVLLRVPAVQTIVADVVADALSEKLGTKVLVGRVDVRLFNRLVVDDLMVYDKQKKQMLRVARLSAAVDILPLFEGEVSISSAQLFGMNAQLYKKDALSQLNCQFVIDSLSSKDTINKTPLNLNIASLIIRNGNISYDEYDKPMDRGTFSLYHIGISNLSSHIILYKLTDDSLNLSLKRMSLEEKSGVRVRNLSFDMIKSTRGLCISDFLLAMDGTVINMPRMKVAYQMQGDSLKPGTLRYDGSIYAKEIDPMDFSAFLDDKVLSAIPRFTAKVSSTGTDKAMDATAFIHSLQSDALALQTSVKVWDILSDPSFDVLLSKCNISESLLKAVTSQFSLPSQLADIGSIDIKGRVRGAGKNDVSGSLDINASNIGKAALTAMYKGSSAKIHLQTPALNVARVVRDQGLGTLTCNIDAYASTTNGKPLTAVKAIAGINGTVKGVIGEVTYNDYTYKDIKLDASLRNSCISGSAFINDPNIRLDAKGAVALGAVKNVNATVSLKEFSPETLHLSNALGNRVLNIDAVANMKGSSIDDMLGTLSLNDVSLIDHTAEEKNAYLDNLTLSSKMLSSGEKEVVLLSDMADVTMRGNIRLSSIPQSLVNLLAQHLPSLIGLPASKRNNNNFSIDATLKNLTFAKQLVTIPLEFNDSITLNGFINSSDNSADLTLNAPDLCVSGMNLDNTLLHLWTPEGTIHTSMTTVVRQKNNKSLALAMDCRGQDNYLYTTTTWDNMRSRVFKGTLNTVSQFYTDIMGKKAIKMTVPHSNFEVGDTLWRIHSQGVEYAEGKLSVEHFAIENDQQYVYVDGVASKEQEDSIVAELHNVDVEYIMNLINFHSVEFAGFASGRAVAYGVMGDVNAKAHLDVSDFLFEHGHLGTMHADVAYNNEDKDINIDAVCDDPEAQGRMLINGNISPKQNTIDLMLKEENTRLEFMNSFCGSFMKDINMRGNGLLRLAGPLNAINLTGFLETEGDFTITSTNCHYTMPGDTITFVPNDIQFNRSPLIDRYGNTAYLSGGVHHQNLGRISFDLTTESDKFLVYDFPFLNGETFCGHAIIDGSIGLHGKGNEIDINADCTTLTGSYIEYNASSPDAIKTQDFIQWGSMDAKLENGDSIDVAQKVDANNSGNERSNVRMNLMINATPETKLHLLMDAVTGDYIDLYGNGALRVNFYNKGSMEIFGNYAIDHGTYKMTIQNILRRDFEFQKGGTIAFGGDPYNAVINMQAMYKLNSVSLADLNIGSSFKANNVPVNCLMDITGTPAKPDISFSLDLPSLSSDARQMVYSVINSEEIMNQQVLYLLAIGRFYSQQNNSNERAGQTSLAMQSFLSGTLSQQLNNILSQAIRSNKWSFGANITTGADGFSNAEYEGLLSGRLFNNRLVFNGQFGYRDNVTTNSQNFIGDFSLQYLLTPNGHYSLKVYNQANDRYFTRNSLNTQGIGFVIQTEFGK